MIASRRHLTVVLLIVGVLAVGGWYANARGARAAAPNRLALYASVVIGQLLFLRYIKMGIRIPMRELISDVRWFDPLIAIALWCAIHFGSPYLRRLLNMADDRTSNIVPHTMVEALAWIVVACTAGFVEEIVFRGYLQRQTGVVLQAIAFGIAHGYQGVRSVIGITIIGLAFGIVANRRRSLVPGMLAHAGLDLYALAASLSPVIGAR
jgi:membrane protease YdiL (CAAX protease family)